MFSIDFVYNNVYEREISVEVSLSYLKKFKKHLFQNTILD